MGRDCALTISHCLATGRSSRLSVRVRRGAWWGLLPSSFELSLAVDSRVSKFLPCNVYSRRGVVRMVQVPQAALEFCSVVNTG